MSQRRGKVFSVVANAALLGINAPRATVDTLKQMFDNIDAMKVSDEAKNFIKLRAFIDAVNSWLTSNSQVIMLPIPPSALEDVEAIEFHQGVDEDLADALDVEAAKAGGTLIIKLRNGTESRLAVIHACASTTPPAVTGIEDEDRLSSSCIPVVIFYPIMLQVRRSRGIGDEDEVGEDEEIEGGDGK